MKKILITGLILLTGCSSVLYNCDKAEKRAGVRFLGSGLQKNKLSNEFYLSYF